MSANESFELAQRLQNLLVAQATGSTEDNMEYVRLRQFFISNPAHENLLPPCVRTCRNLDQFWQFIKYKFRHYSERRDFLWEQFSPLLSNLEKGGTPSDKTVSGTFEKLDLAHINSVWHKALERRTADPEGAITTARTLLETVCKNILDDFLIQYASDADLPKLYRLTSEALNIAPSQHTEQVFKQILGGCTAVVEGLGSLRNKISDAHGHGKRPVKPAPRHAELAVNLAGSLSSFLIETFEDRKGREI